MRPIRRFGKTLNLSMVRYFFEKRGEDLSGLVADLSIWRAGDVYRAHLPKPGSFDRRLPDYAGATLRR